MCGPGSSVGTATDYRLDGLGSNPGGGDFPSVQTGPGTHPASCEMCTKSFPWVKCGRGVMLTTHPLLVLQSWKTTHPMGHIGPVTGSLYLYKAMYCIDWHTTT